MIVISVKTVVHPCRHPIYQQFRPAERATCLLQYEWSISRSTDYLVHRGLEEYMAVGLQVCKLYVAAVSLQISLSRGMIGNAN